MQQNKNKKGFTLIELLIVVVIIGILAAIAIPKFANTKEKAFIASEKADLKNLVNIQESFFADSGRYANLTDLQAIPEFNWNVSGTNSVTGVAGDNTGWSAELTNPGVVNLSSQKNCYIYSGGGSPTAGAAATHKGVATVDGAPTCGP
jgi:type IV pilus assembly protein PilA